MFICVNTHIWINVNQIAYIKPTRTGSKIYINNDVIEVDIAIEDLFLDIAIAKSQKSELNIKTSKKK